MNAWNKMVGWLDVRCEMCRIFEVDTHCTGLNVQPNSAQVRLHYTCHFSICTAGMPAEEICRSDDFGNCNGVSASAVRLRANGVPRLK